MSEVTELVDHLRQMLAGEGVGKSMLMHPTDTRELMALALADDPAFWSRWQEAEARAITGLRTVTTYKRRRKHGERRGLRRQYWQITTLHAIRGMR